MWCLIRILHQGPLTRTPVSRTQGPNLMKLISSSSKLASPHPLISVDLNGVPATGGMEVLDAALPLIDLLHLNSEEASRLTGVAIAESLADLAPLREAAQAFLRAGVAVVAITLGAAGVYVAVNPHGVRFEQDSYLCTLHGRLWVGQEVALPALALSEGAEVSVSLASPCLIA